MKSSQIITNRGCSLPPGTSGMVKMEAFLPSGTAFAVTKSYTIIDKFFMYCKSISPPWSLKSWKSFFSWELDE